MMMTLLRRGLVLWAALMAFNKTPWSGTDGIRMLVAGEEAGDAPDDDVDVYDMDASNNYLPSSDKRDVEITNPYYSGCFFKHKPGWTKKRVCSKREPQNYDLCDPPAFEEYMEIRIGAGNWDSATALSWLIQIILSEIVGVPTSVEAADFESSRNFYDPTQRVDNDRGLSPTEALSTATAVRDCLLHDQSDPETYEPCSHFMPETWGISDDPIRNEQMEPPQALGVLGTEAWFVTKFTVEEYPQLVSYHGLGLPENQELLAGLFKRPTTWGDYCSEVSVNNCTLPDEVAQRAPQGEVEEQSMFAHNLYTGHFRHTEKNNCTLLPENCTGHIANYPCGWMSNMETNLHYLGIALDSKNGPNSTPNGYTASQLRQMWDAANWTKSHLMMMWWKPEQLFQKYLGTDAEMQQVYLKPYTHECHEARAYLKKECAPDLETRIGNESEACENPTEPLRKMVSFNLYDTLHAQDIPSEAISPAYDVLRRFHITDVQLEELFNYLEEENTPRDAICKYAVKYYDDLQATVPISYPRMTQNVSKSALSVVAVVFSGVATMVVMVTSFLVYINRDRLAIKLAQLDFLSFLLTGSFVICVGAILAGHLNKDWACVTSMWFVYVGYTLELVPLIVKVSATNRMMAAAKRLRRVTLGRKSLYRSVGLITAIVLVLLTVWTILDPPRTQPEYSMSNKVTMEGLPQQHIVHKTYFCSSETTAWQFAAEGWNTVLLLSASVLAFQSRNLVQHFNESRTLAFMIYSHFVFVLFRMSTFMLGGDSVKGGTLESMRSLSYALDQVATCIIYFLPKLTAHRRGEGAAYPSSDTMSNFHGSSSPSRIWGLPASAVLGLPRGATGAAQDARPRGQVLDVELPESSLLHEISEDHFDAIASIIEREEAKFSEARSSQTEVIENMQNTLVENPGEEIVHENKDETCLHDEETRNDDVNSGDLNGPSHQPEGSV